MKSVEMSYDLLRSWDCGKQTKIHFLYEIYKNILYATNRIK